MTDLRKAAEQALEALDYEAEEEPDSIWKEERDALRQALNVDPVSMRPEYVDETAKHKREWVGLTKDEVDSWELPDSPTVFEFAQFIEAKLKEKNSG